MAKKLFYKIGEACKKVDVQPYVLRYWETEFEVLSPDKSKSGQRVYSEQDLAVIRRIKELLYDEGYTTVGAKKKLESELADSASPLGGAAGAAGDGGSKAKQRAEAGDVTPDEAPDEAADDTAAAAEGEPEPEQPSDESSEEAPQDEATPAAREAASDGVEHGEQALRAGVEEALKQARNLLQLLRSRAGDKTS